MTVTCVVGFQVRERARQNVDRLLIVDGYHLYVSVAGKQAVLVLSCDNAHMSEEVLVEPGLVMIFAHGIE